MKTHLLRYFVAAWPKDFTLPAPRRVSASNSLSKAITKMERRLAMLRECVARHHLLARELVPPRIEFGILTRRGEPLCPAAVESSELLREDGAIRSQAAAVSCASKGRFNSRVPEHLHV